MVGGQPGGVGAAPVERGADARHEGRVVGKPPVHVRDALEAEPALAQPGLDFGQAGIAPGLQCSRLPPDADVFRYPAANDAATPGKPSPTSPGITDGIADRPPGLLPKNSTIGASASPVSRAHAGTSWSARTVTRTRS